MRPRTENCLLLGGAEVAVATQVLSHKIAVRMEVFGC